MKKDQRDFYLALVNEAREVLNNRFTGRAGKSLTTTDKKRLCMILYHHYLGLEKKGKEDTDDYLNSLPTMLRENKETQGNE